jgi:hypothetical protein
MASSKQIFTPTTSTQIREMIFFVTVHFTANNFRTEINSIEASIKE